MLSHVGWQLGRLVAREKCVEGWSAGHGTWSGGHVSASDLLHVASLGSLTSPILIPTFCDPQIHWMLSCMVGFSPFCVFLHIGSMTWHMKWSRDHSTWSWTQNLVGGWSGGHHPWPGGHGKWSGGHPTFAISALLRYVTRLQPFYVYFGTCIQIFMYILWNSLVARVSRYISHV